MNTFDPRLKKRNEKVKNDSSKPISSVQLPSYPDEVEYPMKSISEQVNNYLNEASMEEAESVKISHLRAAQDLLFNKDPELIDNYTDEIIAFQTDESFKVKCFVVSYIREACIKEPSLMTKLYPNYLLTLENESTFVAKLVVRSATMLHPYCLMRMIKNPDEAHESMWKVYRKLQSRILDYLETTKDGLTNQTVKFFQVVILTMSSRPRSSSTPLNNQICHSLEDIPVKHPFMSRDDLAVEGKKLLSRFLNFVVDQSISSSSLLVAMVTLSEFANDRPQFMASIVQTFESLHATLPPTLAKDQVANVRKQLKMHLLKLLRQSEAHQYHPQITTLLYALGTNANEIARNMPRDAGGRDKKFGVSKRKVEEEDYGNKKPKLDSGDVSAGTSVMVDSSKSGAAASSFKTSASYNACAINFTAQELAPFLTPENVANLVLLSMVMLPERIPDAFQASYTPIESAGTKEQIQLLARLLATQMTAVGIGSGIKKASAMQLEEETRRRQEKQKKEKENEISSSISTVIGGVTMNKSSEEKSASDGKKNKSVAAVELHQPQLPVKSAQLRIKGGFRLKDSTNELSLQQKQTIIEACVMRILHSEARSSTIHSLWQGLVTKLVARFGGNLHSALADYILEDIRNRSNLAFKWLYEEYNICVENSRGGNDKEAQKNYSAALNVILRGILDKHDAKEGIFAKMMQQAPLLTDGAIKLLQEYCEDQRHHTAALQLAKTLMSHRPQKKMHFLKLLFELAASPNEEIRKGSIDSLVEMYNQNKMSEQIKFFAINNIKNLACERPPLDKIKLPAGEDGTKWGEETIKQCMMLLLSLLPHNHQLIESLAEVYVQAHSSIKRHVLRALDEPIGDMGMDSPQLLQLVEHCPMGAETLVTRMLHILTDKEHASPDLTEKVRDLHRKRVPDVRFLIPVITGLTKDELMEALPKLILHKPNVVQGVISRLLRSRRQSESDLLTAGPVTPQELLIHLHNFDFRQGKLQFLIKAINMCIAEKSIYTPEVIVGVINKLLEQTTFPPLMMRTLLQALIQYPRISNYVVTVLNRLVARKAWNSPKTWQGFIKCCQRLKRLSFEILLKLPVEQLESVFDVAGEMREHLRAYLQMYNDPHRLDPLVIELIFKSEEQLKREKAAAVQQKAMEDFQKQQKEWEEKHKKIVQKHVEKADEQKNVADKEKNRSDQQKASALKERSNQEMPDALADANRKVVDRVPTPTQDEQQQQDQEEKMEVS